MFVFNLIAFFLLFLSCFTLLFTYCCHLAFVFEISSYIDPLCFSYALRTIHYAYVLHSNGHVHINTNNVLYLSWCISCTTQKHFLCGFYQRFMHEYDDILYLRMKLVILKQGVVSVLWWGTARLFANCTERFNLHQGPDINNCLVFDEYYAPPV